MFGNKFINEGNLKVTYKLLHDLLFILFIFFALALIAEGLLPGIVSSHVGLYKIVLVILLVIFLINAASKEAGIATGSCTSKKFGFILVFILAALIFIGMRGIGLLVSIFVLSLALAALHLFYKIFFPPTTSL